MCHESCLAFAARALTHNDVHGQRVLEVGSFDVNGSVRPIVNALGPTEYLGVDVSAGPGVDQVCAADDLLTTFGPDSWDLVVSTEMLEHVEDWRTVVRNLKGVLRPGGALLVTTRSEGFPWHAHPSDTWRYSIADMRRIFADFAIERLEVDSEAPGVFLKARKPAPGAAADLESIELYRMTEPV